MRKAPLAFILALLSVLFAETTSAAALSFAEKGTSLELAKVLPKDTAVIHKEPKRLVAAALALTLGPLGVHRLYLGTDVKVPLIYGLTFGGFGVLAVIDLGEILFTKNLGPFMNNDKVFMWSKDRSGSSTPP
ncbi:MAG: NINE protein [Flavobacteriales bacterium]